MRHKVIYIEGIPVRLLPRKRRSIRLSWDRRERLIHCFYPRSLSSSILKEFLEKRKRRVRELYSQSFVPVESALLLYRGKEYRILLNIDGNGQDFIRDDFSKTIKTPLLNDEVLFFQRWRDYLKREAPLYFEDKIRTCEKKTGLKASIWRFRAMRSRWGSASAQGGVTLNTLLVMAPGYVVDYVILHELAHLKIPDHSPRFWNEVEHFMPDYRIRKAWLRDNGNRLLSLY